jgi:hypothetical protein
VRYSRAAGKFLKVDYRIAGTHGRQVVYPVIGRERDMPVAIATRI